MIVVSGSNPNHFVAEASDIGFAVGAWPVSFVWNGHTFYRAGVIRHSGEFAGMEYRTVSDHPAGVSLGMTVLND